MSRRLRHQAQRSNLERHKFHLILTIPRPHPVTSLNWVSRFWARPFACNEVNNFRTRVKTRPGICIPHFPTDVCIKSVASRQLIEICLRYRCFQEIKAPRPQQHRQAQATTPQHHEISQPAKSTHRLLPTHSHVLRPKRIPCFLPLFPRFLVCFLCAFSVDAFFLWSAFSSASQIALERRMDRKFYSIDDTF